MMNDRLRLYFESVVRMAIASDPSSASDEQLLGMAGVLPVPAVTFSEWCKKLGFEDAEEQEQPSRLTEEEAGKINDLALRNKTLMELERNGRES